MRDSMAQSDLHPIQGNGEISPINNESAEPSSNGKLAVHDGSTGALVDTSPVVETPSTVQSGGSPSRQEVTLPQRGLYYATITGVIAGVVVALLTIVITLVFAGTFHAASQQIAVDRLTVKTALALAGLELLNVTLSLLIGFLVGVIIGRIAVRRRLGFLAGVLAGAIFYLITFLVDLISSYPGNLSVNGTTLTTGSLIISLLLFCLWSMGGGLVSLFGAWITTMRHPHYLRRGE